jgi:hypothetical protein
MKKVAFVAFMDFIGFDFLRASATFKFAFLQLASVRAMLNKYQKRSRGNTDVTLCSRDS